MFSVLFHFQHPVHIALPLALLLDHLCPKRVTFNPVFRQRQRQFFVIGHQIDCRQQIIATAAGKENRQTQQAAQMLGYARRYGVLLIL